MSKINTGRAALGFAAAVIAGCVAVAATASATVRAMADPSAVAVIRLSAVLEGLDERAELEQRVQESIDQRQADIDELGNQLRDITEQLETVIRPGSDEYLEALQRAAELRATVQVRGEAFQQIIAGEKGAIFVQLFAKIKEASEAVAVRDGYDIVLIDDADSGFPLVAEGAVIQEIQTRSVLFAADSVDITDNVRRYLNNQFQSGQ